MEEKVSRFGSRAALSLRRKALTDKDPAAGCGRGDGLPADTGVAVQGNHADGQNIGVDLTEEEPVEEAAAHSWRDVRFPRGQTGREQRREGVLRDDEGEVGETRVLEGGGHEKECAQGHDTVCGCRAGENPAKLASARRQRRHSTS